ncbi:MAG: META domain-containing protein [Chloroflexi bacterium]|nr:META domain-containing protein [Chloroflexota bacterium]
MKKGISLSVLFLLLVAGMFACTSVAAPPATPQNPSGSTPAPVPGAENPPGSSASLSLEGVTWILESFSEGESLKLVLQDTDITLVFDKSNGRLHGSGGVNTYTGGYQVAGANLVIRGPIASTMMAGPQNVMDQESRYLTVVQTAESFKIEGKKLQLMGGRNTLNFRQK